MDGLSISDFSGTDNCLHIEIALAAWRPTDTDTLISNLGVQSISIDIRMDGNRLDAKFLAGAYDAQGNFATIGD